MTVADNVFVDTNVLVYATNTSSPWYLLARERLQEAKQQADDLIISPQIIREYLSFATRSSVVSGSPSMSETFRNVHTFRTHFRVVQNTTLVLDHLIALLRVIPCAGKQVHDANIVATMLAYNVSHLLTHNVRDFGRFAQHITIMPLERTP
ncbi:MAG: type II toxin-antitoxin system VapC family toxin [Herpetosiphon sp.]